ncbi:hypothetical protein G6F46_005794 [Rhizopus delemar]|nr:hypothetical protein G6F55_004387 [Rhizopus delemar]KAG1630603.1 hypothetical protein G6F45_005381 [Rhizopus arrhizus]KAG1512186.1 hypothetical protein G6F53_005375 [Rhizopus delemar]KAG1527029.1 hypothetical protein G6F52_001901 [Rhizopus delemar]KAG1557866.1 hypothetical protein G6F49_005006 [Rhizopus delemar]
MTPQVIFILLCLFQLTFSLEDYREGESVPLYYNKIFSLRNPLTYSIQSLPFICQSQQSSARKKSSLVFDQDLRGDRLIQSGYKVNVLEDQECKLLCKQTLGVEDAIKISDLVSDEYQVEWELDGLPGATVSYTNEAPEHNYRIGFPLGFKIGNMYYLNNHVIIQILYEKNQAGRYNILGFEIYPDSIAEGGCTKKSIDYQHQRVLERRFTVFFTYSVKWKQANNIRNRWDTYLIPPNPERYKYASLNSIIVAILLSTIVVLILYKTSYHRTSPNQDDKDIKIYEDVEDYAGWRLIDRDVFRRPVYGGLLTPLMGTGIQLLVVAFGLLFALFKGWYHPAEPTSFTQWFTCLFFVGSIPAGYWSARIYKVFRGKSWILNSLLTSCIVPTIVLSIFFGTNVLTWSQQSSLAISFSGWISMISIFIFVLVPFTFLGAYLGEKHERLEYPSRTTQIPRIIPAKRWYQLNFIRVIMGGIIPFSVIYLNWHEFLSSLIKGEYVLSITYTVQCVTALLITTSTVTIILVFVQLCTEDYLWWWQSFLIGGSSSIYMLS